MKTISTLVLRAIRRGVCVGGEWREGKSSRGPHAVLLSQRLKYTQGVMKVQCVYKLCTVSYITQRVRVQPAIHQCIILVLLWPEIATYKTHVSRLEMCTVK